MELVWCLCGGWRSCGARALVFATPRFSMRVIFLKARLPSLMYAPRVVRAVETCWRVDASTMRTGRAKHRAQHAPCARACDARPCAQEHGGEQGRGTERYEIRFHDGSRIHTRPRPAAAGSVLAMSACLCKAAGWVQRLLGPKTPWHHLNSRVLVSGCLSHARLFAHACARTHRAAREQGAAAERDGA